MPKISKPLLIIMLATVLVVSVSLNVLLYVQYQTVKQANDDFTLYYNEYGNASVISRSYDFSPPVSMYRALRIALESDGWNTTSLSNMTVGINLNYGKFGNYTGPILMSFERIKEVTEKVGNYARVTVNGTTYRYYWNIVVTHSGEIFQIPPPGYYWVDAATAEIIPHGIP